MPPDEGQELLNGKYRRVRSLGEGAFGSVFLCLDVLPARHVAIKVLNQQRQSEENLIVREMRHLAGLHHPGIAALFEHFRHDGRLHLVMEYCPGGSLRDRIDSGPVTQDQAFEWCRKLGETLQFVHDRKVVHHDIKPDNILFGTDGAIKMGDFGIANTNGGTPYYMAPELLLREQVARTDARVDIYALAVTLLELLADKDPFDSLSPPERLQAKIRHDFIPRSLPGWVQELLLKALNPVPELRFQTTKEFCQAIDSRHVPYLLDSDRIVAHRLAEKAEAQISRKKWKAAQKNLELALSRSADCVAALVASGRLQLLLRRVDRAAGFLNHALAVNPRVSVQKELGWIQLERGNYPLAISMLNDYLQRNAADFEACNLLIECFYLTNRYEQAEDLAVLMMQEKGSNHCFENQQVLCRILSSGFSDAWLKRQKYEGTVNPFLWYNVMVATESPSSWESNGRPSLKSKLLFQDYRFGHSATTIARNAVAITQQGGEPTEYSGCIIGIGRLKASDICLEGPGVSRRHSVIVNFTDDVWIYDLGSATGTRLDGELVKNKAFLDGVRELKVGPVSLKVSAKRGLLV